MATCKTQGCTNQTATGARRYCDECREIRKAPNAERPGDLLPEKLFFSVAGVTHHPASRAVSQGELLYLVRDPENPHDAKAIEVRRANGDVIGYVPRQGFLQGRFGYRPYTQGDLAAALDAGASYTLRCYAAGGAVQAEGHCNGWFIPHPARVEVWAKRGSGGNRPPDPLPFTVEHRVREAVASPPAGRPDELWAARPTATSIPWTAILAGAALVGTIIAAVIAAGR